MKLTDQVLAEHLLKRKELGGRHLPFSMRQKIGCSLWGALLLIAFILQIFYPDNPIASFLFGLVIAAVASDYAWYKATRLTWPLVERIINWGNVYELSRSKSEQSAP